MPGKEVGAKIEDSARGGSAGGRPIMRGGRGGAGEDSAEGHDEEMAEEVARPSIVLGSVGDAGGCGDGRSARGRSVAGGEGGGVGPAGTTTGRVPIVFGRWGGAGEGSAERGGGSVSPGGRPIVL